jgi:WD40 repeat protein
VFRIYNSESGALVKEVRRGTTHRTINNLSFDKYSHYLVACSDADKIHVFKVEQQTSAGGLLSWGSSWMPAQLKDEYSFAYFCVEPSKVGPVVAVLNTDYLHVLSKKDYYCKVEMSAQGGELKRD